jgi:hypothetical protein
MDDVINSSEMRPNLFQLPDVSPDQRDLTGDPAEILLFSRRKVVEDTNRFTSPNQFLGNMRTDKTRAARYQKSRHCCSSEKPNNIASVCFCVDFKKFRSTAFMMMLDGRGSAPRLGGTASFSDARRARLAFRISFFPAWPICRSRLHTEEDRGL